MRAAIFLLVFPDFFNDLAGGSQASYATYEEGPFGNKTVAIIYFQVVVGGSKMIESKMNNNM